MTVSPFLIFANPPIRYQNKTLDLIQVSYFKIYLLTTFCCQIII
ncbi:hypothetical protein HMPREF1881_00190 [Streptococcus agalactiae]|nr:hypothetical protein HMPREF1881_00190 [Streptococcus agalactiae]